MASDANLPRAMESKADWEARQKEPDFVASAEMGHAATDKLLEAVRLRLGAEWWDKQDFSHQWLVTIDQVSRWLGARWASRGPALLAIGWVTRADGKHAAVAYDNFAFMDAMERHEIWRALYRHTRRHKRQAFWALIKERLHV